APSFLGALGRAHQALPVGRLRHHPGGRDKEDDEGDREAHRAEGKDGARFSRMARAPSFTSSKPKHSISRARDWSKMGPAWRSQLLSARLANRIAGWLPPASASATDQTVSMSLSAGTPRLPRPLRSPSPPPMHSL